MLDQEIGLTFKGLMSLIKNNPLNETSKIKYVRHKSNGEFSELFDNVFLNIAELVNGILKLTPFTLKMAK